MRRLRQNFARELNLEWVPPGRSSKQPALGVKELAVKDRELMMSNHMAGLREEDE